MIIYQRGDRIPEALRDRRFYTKSGTLSTYAMQKWWRLLDDGKPDPDCLPFNRVFEIELIHKPGEYKILHAPKGRPSNKNRRKS
jgi:hypothetical protein